MSTLRSSLGRRFSPATVLVGVLAASGFGCVGIGVTALFFPVASASRLGYEFATVGGRVEFLTFYGGFYLGIGMVLLAATKRPNLRPGAMAFLALSATAAIPVRVGSMIQYGVSEALFYALLIGETAFAAVGWVGWYWTSRSGGDGGTDFPGGER